MNWNLDNKILIQGFNQAEILPYLQLMKDTGTNIVAGVQAGCNQQDNYDFPVFDLVEQAIAQYGEIQTTIIFNNSYEVLDAAYEAIASGIKQIIINSSGVPPLDLLKVLKKAQEKKVLILGPGNSGIIIPEKMCLGKIETKFYQAGEIAIINTGDWSLNYEVALCLNEHNLGQSIAINLGNENIISSSISSWLEMLKKDEKTAAIILVISDEKYLTKKEIETCFTQKSNKPILVYLVDKSNLKTITINNSSKMIADQVPLFFEQISNRDELINALNIAKIEIIQKFLEIPEILKKLKLIK